MALHRFLSIAALCLAAPAAAAAPGSLVCVIHDRAFHMSLTGSYFYGITDTLVTLEGQAEILWEAAPNPLKSFSFEPITVSRVQIDRSDLTLDMTKVLPDGKKTVQAHIKISGKRVETDPTTFRSSYQLEIGRVAPVTTAAKVAAVATPAIKVLHTAEGYAECSAN